MSELMEMNTVKYSAYRLALKLRRVQQRLCLDLLDLEAAVLGFDMHGLTPDRHDMAIEIPEMVLILHSIYETLDQEEPEEIEVPLCVELCLNWLLNVYDGARIGQVRVLAFKIGLLVLCRGPLTEKYLQMYKLVAGIGGKMRPRQLGILLFDCVQIPRVLGEIASFGGSNIEPSVRSCFALGGGGGGGGAKKDSETLLAEIDVKLYLGWLKAEPQALVWLPVLHRLSAAEAAKHNAKCGVCKRVPITSFRYHCLKCFNFDLCHNCFFVGKTARGHKAEHPMREYCTSTGASVNLKNFGQSLRNSFRSKKYFKKKQSRLGYLPARSVLEGDDFKTPAPSLSLSPNLSMESRDLLEGSFNSSLQPRIIHPAQSSLLSSNNLAVSAAEAAKEDEHEIIARMCREVARAEGTCTSDDEDECDEEGEEEEGVAAQIKELEAENRRLAEERDELKVRVRLEGQEEDVGEEGGGGEAVVDNRAAINENDMKKEAKELKQSTARMETRMRILADHNEQLEAQLNRLRQLLVTEMNADGNRNFGTLQSKDVIAAELDNSADSAGGGNEVVDNRPQPPPSQQFSQMAGQVGKEIYELVTSLRKQNIAEAAKTRSGGEEDEDSLGLSDHETQRVAD